MQSPQDPSQSNKQIFNQPRSTIIAIAVLMLLVAIFLIGVISGSGSSDCSFSLFCNAINPPSPDVPALILGTAATIVLVTVINAPLAVSVGVGIVIWLAVRSFL